MPGTPRRHPASASKTGIARAAAAAVVNGATIPEGVRPQHAIDAIADLVLAYRPKPKSNPAKKRKRRSAKIAREREG